MFIMVKKGDFKYSTFKLIQRYVYIVFLFIHLLKGNTYVKLSLHAIIPLNNIKGIQSILFFSGGVV